MTSGGRSSAARSTVEPQGSQEAASHRPHARTPGATLRVSENGPNCEDKPTDLQPSAIVQARLQSS